jgi:TonB family protein
VTPALGANVLAYSCQVAVIALAAWAAAGVGRIRVPRLLLPYYQGTLVLGLALPLLSTLLPPHPIGSTPLLRVVGAARITDGHWPAVSQALTLGGLVLIAGCGVRLSWLVLGLLRLRAYRCGARELGRLPEALADLERSIGSRARWFLSDEINGAATYGVLRPVVLLPAAQVEDADAILRMVACHELIHVARRDWACVVAEELLRAVFWFHPGVWFLLDRIDLHREQVVDERVVAVTGDRQRYARALLDCAGRDWSLQPRSASTWLHARHLRARILWLAKGGSMSKRRFTLSAVALAMVLGASGVVAIFAVPLPGSEASVVGQAGARVYDVHDEGVSLPQVVTEIRPTYTPEAMNAKIEGTMAVAAIVKTDGTVGDVRLTRSLDPTYGLDDQGIKAAKQWRFRPGTKDGTPVAVRVALEFSFTLK